MTHYEFRALKEFLLDGKARQFTVPTLEHYRGRLGGFARWATEQEDAPATVADVTPSLLRAYLVHLQERKLASNTQHTHARALRAFFNEVTPDSPLFVSESERNHDGRLTRSGLYGILKRIGKAAGVANCTAHTFRHSFALWALRSGVDV